MSEKNIYDLIKQSHGYKAVEHGWFEECHILVTGNIDEFSNDDFTIIELPMCFWRVRKAEVEKEEFRKYLARAIKHQEKNIEKQKT